ncbi:DNA polymerase IV [Celerinatantimonas diazotrophica]|uniref:DNA polymerase IV n=1 Tax=Celerinatantimonas diazotrophica TaxID=412034 RepID=A0A4V2PRF8_9GAMM|nr:DNA polymerase IV [Celerinatantimonas diazotrophica]TCK58661.1 DNA polymerase-4 [Celerinatantimonas diazotrophica]CAG9297290.1 DNA polymerase IV [Celerinatantimonas diazotrophica]
MRKIIHVDMDCFYAAVEMRDNPALKEVPIAIGGSKETRGVIATCNYPARQYGIHSAMPTAQALKLCPHLVLVRGRMALYKEVSAQIREIFLSFTPLVEPLSLDEAYLDVTNVSLCQGSATLMAEEIRRQILAKTALTASAGVAPNKFLAKIASEENKPDGLFVIAPEQAGTFARSVQLNKIPGVGPRTWQRLQEFGLFTGQDVLAHSPEQLSQWFGKFGLVLYQRSQGIDERSVEPTRIRKSVGIEHTYPSDFATSSQCLDALLAQLPELRARLGKRSFHGVQVKLKFTDFTQTTVACRSSGLYLNELQALVEKAYQRGRGKKVRLVGLSVSLCDDQHQQLSLSFDC